MVGTALRSQGVGRLLLVGRTADMGRLRFCTSPSGAAQALIRIASKHPAVVREALV